MWCLGRQIGAIPQGLTSCMACFSHDTCGVFPGPAPLLPTFVQQKGPSVVISALRSIYLLVICRASVHGPTQSLSPVASPPSSPFRRHCCKRPVWHVRNYLDVIWIVTESTELHSPCVLFPPPCILATEILPATSLKILLNPQGLETRAVTSSFGT